MSRTERKLTRSQKASGMRRKQILEQSGERYFSECLLCQLDCSRITNDQRSTFSLVKCPKLHPELYKR